jgi:gluconolactonase
VSANGEHTVVAELGRRPAGAAIGPDGRCYVCNDGGWNPIEVADGRGRLPERNDPFTPGGGCIQAVDLETGAFETLYTESDGWPIGAANDIVFDEHGGFYFTDFVKRNHRTASRGRICYARPEGGSIKDVIAPIEAPNGIGLSPDGRTLYVAQADSARLWAFPIAAPGVVENGDNLGLAGRMLCALPDFCGFDSLGVDGAGYVVVATTRTGRLTIVDPLTGSWRQIDVGDAHVTNICWGGEGLRTAYITLSGEGMLASMEWERPGLALHFLNR